MSDLLASIQQTQRAQREELEREYASILRRSESPKDGDASRLTQLIDELGYPMDDVRADLENVKAVGKFQKRIDALGLDDPEEAEKLETEASKIKEEIAAHQEEYDKETAIPRQRLEEATRPLVERQEEIKQRAWTIKDLTPKKMRLESAIISAKAKRNHLWQ